MLKPFRSIKLQLSMILILVSLIPLFIVSYFAQSFMFKASSEFITENVTLNVQNGTDRVESYLNQYIQPLNELMISSEFQQFLKVAEHTEAAQGVFITDIMKYYNDRLLNKPDIVSILFLHESSTAYHISKYINARMDYTHSFKDDPIYKPVFDMKSPQLIGPHAQTYLVNPEQDVVTFVMPMRNFSNFHIEGWILLELNLPAIVRLLNETQTGMANTILLYNTNDGTYISNIDIDNNLEKKLSGHFTASSPESAKMTIDIGSSSYLAIYQALRMSDWKLVSLTSFDSLLEGTRSAWVVTLAISAISFIIALVISYRFILWILTPLYRLKNSMSLYGAGIRKKIIDPRDNELGFLIRTYNQMLDERDRLEKEILQSKEKELLQLQAQVNPHFLFNTLGTIEALSEKGDKREVADMIHEVSLMLRYNIKNDKGWVLLREEIEYIRHFQNIHYYRYDRAVNIQYRVDPETLDMPFIKLGLQPFVENALKYGWNDLENSEYFSIEILGYLDGDKLHVRISDNGPGFDDSILLQLHQLMQEDSESISPYFINHTGIYNTYRRFHLVYGEAMSMTLYNQEGSGAVVHLAIPATYYTREEMA